MEAAIPEGTYAVFAVQGLEHIGQVWQESMQWQSSQTEWKGYCGPDGCDCANHPCFELYPPDFGETQKLYICLPVQKA